jgi:hypothetical protein
MTLLVGGGGGGGSGQFEGQKEKLSSLTVLVSMGIFLPGCLHIF